MGLSAILTTSAQAFLIVKMAGAAKAALFFMAFLPQFVAPSAGSKIWAFLKLAVST